MFCKASDTVFTFEATIKFRNETVTTWNQPIWGDMDWLQKKRWQRPMTYLDTICEGHTFGIFDAMTQGIANDHGPDVIFDSSEST